MATKPVPKSILVTPDLPAFPVHTSNKGCRLLATSLWFAIKAKVSRFEVELEDLIYITQLAFQYRVVSVNVDGSINQRILGVSALKQAISKVELPTILADYIEAIGIVTLASGIKISPMYTSQTSIKKTWERFESRRDRGKRATEPLHELIDGELVEGDICPITWDRITRYNQQIIRAASKAVQLRKVDYTNLEGKATFMITHEGTTPRVTGRAPQAVTEAEAKLGAIYSLRTLESYDKWVCVNMQMRVRALRAI